MTGTDRGNLSCFIQISIVGTLSAIKGTVIASVMAVNGEHKEHHNAC